MKLLDTLRLQVGEEGRPVFLGHLVGHIVGGRVFVVPAAPADEPQLMERQSVK